MLPDDLVGADVRCPPAWSAPPAVPSPDRGDYAPDVTTRDELRRLFADHVATTAKPSPLWSELSRRIVTEPEGEAIIELVMPAPERQRRPVLFFAALHDLLLEDPREALGAHLRHRWPDPNHRPLDDPWPLVVDLVARRGDEIAHRCATRQTQTNEASRAAVILLVLDHLTREVGELSLVEIGSSAGLLLQLDRYEYHFRDDAGTERVLGPPASHGEPVVLRCRLRSSARAPRTLPVVRERVGIDPMPVDISDPDARRWLRACVWPDQIERLATLDAALAAAARDPAPIVRGRAEDLAVVHLESACHHPVLISSWAMTYLSHSARRALWKDLDRWGSQHDLSVVVFEDPSHVPEADLALGPLERDVTVLGLVTWRNGERVSTRWGRAHPHGFWFDPGSPTTSQIS